MKNPKVCILRTDGTNCDEELFYAFEKFGAVPSMIHVNQLRNKEDKLKNYQILALPGGFSYGDDVASGKILAVELISFLKDELANFINNKGLILGICNGFQTLVRTGLLPFNHLGKMSVTLAQNESGHFECHWVKIKTEKSKTFFKNSEIANMAVNHGEGKFYTDDETLQKIENQGLVAFRYVDSKNQKTQKYPANPNGSQNAIAGVCDPTGHIIGLMPHPEKFVEVTQYPNWRREKIKEPQGAFIFKQMIQFSKEA